MSAIYSSSGVLGNELDLGWLVLTFLRVKESEQFRCSFLSDKHINDVSSYTEDISMTDFSIHDENYFSGSKDANNNLLTNYNCTPGVLWRKIEESINALEDDADLDEVFAQYTHILDLHIQVLLL